ncbi:class I histocompatibility antigen, F10 alpha chain-like [Scomber scombrus]|uniref:class I histocompatibility antigen, F10 alpha chain-like n=1 Tax=Scomber scombrus TaxID=13677 RepID=UPI002DD905FF|nr:class I histocompatibility antigen, F10 alpha chain-like [Scomber scombrus]
MKILVVLVLLGLHSAAAVIHSMNNIYTASSQVPNFPEFVVVGMVDDVQTDHYDSNTRRLEPTLNWVKRFEEDDPQFWERNTEILRGIQQLFTADIETVKHRFNQTGGAHVLQVMYGCEWDDETGEINGFTQIGYDGEDFIVFDLKTETWIAPKQQAVITKQKWERAGEGERWKNYFNQRCLDGLKKYVNYGRSSLMRTGRIT